MTPFYKYKVSIRSALQLALPIVAGQLGLVLMGFFDTIQVGGLGAAQMGACGVANGVYFQFMLLAMGVLYAVSPLVSEAFGEHQGWKSIGVMRSAVPVALILSVLFYGVMVIINRHFALLGEDAKITGLGQQFLHVLNYSTPMLLFFTLGKQFMDGQGRTRVAMVITLVGVVSNVTLNWVLIYGKLGMPAYGVAGAAMATGISRTLMCVALWAIILADNKNKQLLAEYLQKNIGRNYAMKIIKIGIPSGLLMYFEIAAFNAGQIMSGWLGEIYLASHQVAINLASITFMMVSGLASAGTIMTGYAFGKKNKEELRVAGNTVYLMAIGSQVVFAAVFLLFHNQLPHLYTSDNTVLTTASQLLLLAALFQLGDGMQVVGSGILRGMQDVRVPSLLAFTSYWIIMVPCSYLLAFKCGMGVYGIWTGFAIGLSVAALLMYMRYRVMLRKIEFTEL